MAEMALKMSGFELDYAYFYRQVPRAEILRVTAPLR